jgi:hypothetical protein
MTALAETGVLEKQRIRVEKNPTECQCRLRLFQTSFFGRLPLLRVPVAARDGAILDPEVQHPFAPLCPFAPPVPGVRHVLR